MKRLQAPIVFPNFRVDTLFICKQFSIFLSQSRFNCSNACTTSSFIKCSSLMNRPFWNNLLADTFINLKCSVQINVQSRCKTLMIRHCIMKSYMPIVVISPVQKYKRNVLKRVVHIIYTRWYLGDDRTSSRDNVC